MPKAAAPPAVRKAAPPPAGPRAFTGFGPEVLDFFERLAANQDRAWFQAHREIYETQARAPMEALVETLAFAFEVHDIPLTGDARRSIFRINRDVRFSKDKVPYKTHVSAALSRDGSRQSPGILYVQVGGGTAGFMATGFYGLEPEDLHAVRQAILADPKGWAAVSASLARQKLALSRDDALSRLPKGFEAQAGSETAELLKLRHFVVRRPLPPSKLHRAELVGDIVAFAEAGVALLRFGRAAIDRARAARPRAVT